MSCDCHVSRVEESGEMESAMDCYREALEINPEDETAKTRLHTLTAAMETKVRVSGANKKMLQPSLFSLPSNCSLLWLAVPGLNCTSLWCGHLSLGLPFVALSLSLSLSLSTAVCGVHSVW